MSQDGSSPGPMASASVAATKLATNRSCRAVGTRNRLGEMHTCPALRNLPLAAASPAHSGSASSSTITGEWPPSSSDTDFSCLDASSMMWLPNGTEPVRVTLRTRESLRIISEIIAGSPTSTLTTPAGMPAASAALASHRAAVGVSSAGLTMIVQPAAVAAAILRAGSRAGKFDGANAPTTPTGSRCTSRRRPAPRAGITRP